jgi:hypothetical protein
MLAHGVPVPTVSQRLGHTRVPTTLNVYPHRIPGADRQAADLLADLIDHTWAIPGHRPQRSATAVANVGPPAIEDARRRDTEASFPV